MNGWPALAQLAQRQFGLVERRQVEACGVSLDALDKRATRERWDRPQPGVLALPGSVDSWERRILAALLAAGHDALATGWTAAYLYGLVAAPRLPLTIVVDHRYRAPVLHRVRTTRSRTLERADARTVRGIPVVCAARMLADLAPDVALTDLRHLAIDACQKRLLTADEVLRTWQRVRGLRGAKRLLAVGLGLLDTPVDSAFEWRLRALLADSDLPRAAPGPCPVKLDGRVIAHVDVAWPEWKVGIECDGFRYHSQRRQLDRDSARQNALTEAGWDLLRVTWTQLRQDEQLILRQIRVLLRRAGCDC